VLIIPLHRRLTTANFPYVTALLIAINVLVFFGWQSGDDKVLEQAAGYYEQVQLAQYELPAYQAWLQKTGGHEQTLPPDAAEHYTPAQLTLLMIQNDGKFLAALRADQVITPDLADYAAWRPLRSEFDRQWQLSFTERHLMHFSEFDLGRMFSAMFLHGGAGHLFGNMLFLAFLGLLVEGALGSGLFLALYLLGGLGGQAFSLFWRWGEQGSALGASGAIAALMGAYCVLWGMRKVRFFYWFFVVFDYVRAPALWLLPFWLGWQVLNLLFNKEAQVGFDAHAGGIASGALLAFIAVALHRQRRDFLDDEEVADDGQAAYQRALVHLGKLEMPQAKALLKPLLDTANPAMPWLLAWYRCCRYQADAAELAAAARRILLYPATNSSERGEIRKVLDDYLTAGSPLPLTDAEVMQQARRWLDAAALDDSERLLRSLAGRTPTLTGLPEAWLQLMRQRSEHNDRAGAAQTCTYILQNFPGTTAAQKAEFLRAANAS
jgi:membrane associated rhomboid family serine protease